MIQFYINSRPIPRAIARHHLEQATNKPAADLNKTIRAAISGDEPARRYLAAYGVEIVAE
jgi:hypothetical protein